jgi:hypothetical protein
MPTFAERLYRIEARQRSLIEGSSARLFSDNQLRQVLTAQLVEAMQTGARPLPNGETAAPNLYSVRLHSIQFETLQAEAALLDELASALYSAGLAEGLTFYSPPVIRVEEDTQAVPHQVQITTRISIEQLDDTTDLPVEFPAGSALTPGNAFLVVNGTHIVPLEQAVINLERRLDNQVVIEDRRVSRVHAQLRAVNGHYMIFDLDSSAGTFVNDQRIHQSLLYPGDVISLGGVPLVYGQEPGSMGQTQKLFPPETRE